jgi:hypothetical protein
MNCTASPTNSLTEWKLNARLSRLISATVGLIEERELIDRLK